MRRHNYRSNNIIPGLDNLPALRYLREPVRFVDELYVHYPDGGEFGWYALVVSQGIFYYWDDIDRRWKPMGVGSGTGNDTVETVYYGISDIVPTEAEEISSQFSTKSKTFTIPEITKKIHFIAFSTKMSLLSVENASFAGDFWYGNGNDSYLQKSIVTINGTDYNVYVMATVIAIAAGAKVVFS